MMDLVLMDVAHAMVYLDDIVIFSTSVDEHIKHIGEVLERLKMAGLKIKHTKYEWAESEVQYFGHIVSQYGIKPDPANIEKVAKYPTLGTVKEVRFCNVSA